MKNLKRFKKAVLLLSIVSMTLSLFFSGLTFGLGIGWKIKSENGMVAGMDLNIFQYMAGGCLFIFLFFLIFTVLQMNNKIFLNIVSLIPLILTLLQCRILVLTKPTNLPNWVTDYSNGLEIVFYMGYFLLIMTFTLIFLQLYSIWYIRHLSNFKAD